MADIKTIISRNALTFYDYATGLRQPLWKRYTILVALAALSAWTFNDKSENLYMSIIAAQSILIGFSFNVMIFLGSNPNIKIPPNASLERKGKIRKLNLLSSELFFNLSYFNLVAIISVVTALLLLASPMAKSTVIHVQAFLVETGLDPSNLKEYIGFIVLWVRTALLFTLYYLIIDSLSSFFRIVKRASYYFETKMALAD
ncbi:MAG TPA: hypothetical protein VE891_00790 [Allosphingosinicella sp.]|nr:hypothetical protein [Allosphingosinicella sp.]